MTTDDVRRPAVTPLRARGDKTDLPTRAVPRSIGRLLEQLDMEAAIGCGWWETDTAAFVTGLVSAGPVAAVFTSIAHLLRDGEDPEVVVGATTAGAAFAVAREWVDAGIDPSEVPGWLSAGCWKPTVAKALTDAGLRPAQLLDDDGQPLHWIEIPTPDGQRVPLARAVAEEFVAVETAIPIVTGYRP